MWKCISIPLRLLLLSIKLPCKCYTIQTFPNLFIVSLTNPVKETRTRSNFTCQATCYIILRVWNLVCCTKSDAESKRQEVGENCIMRKLANLPISANRSLPWRKHKCHLCCEIHARQQLSFTCKLPTWQADIAPPFAWRRVATISFLCDDTAQTCSFFGVY